MALKDWKKIRTNEWINNNGDLIEVSLNQNRPEGGKNSYQTFIFHKGRRIPDLLTKDKLVSKSRAIKIARAYMRRN